MVYDLIENETMKNIPTKEKIKNILICLADSCEKDKELTKLLILEHTRCMQHSCSEPDESKNSFYRLTKFVCGLLEEGVRNGDVKSSIDVKTAADLVTGIHLHSMIVWLKSESEVSFSNNISEKIDMLFKGIGV